MNKKILLLLLAILAMAVPSSWAWYMDGFYLRTEMTNSSYSPEEKWSMKSTYANGGENSYLIGISCFGSSTLEANKKFKFGTDNWDNNLGNGGTYGSSHINNTSATYYLSQKGDNIKFNIDFIGNIQIIESYPNNNATFVIKFFSGEKTIYFRNANNWNDPYVHFYNNSGLETKWPGIPMRQVAGNLYAVVVPSTATNLQFSNKGSNSVTVSNPKDYYEYSPSSTAGASVASSYKLKGNIFTNNNTNVWNDGLSMTANADGTYSVTTTCYTGNGDNSAFGIMLIDKNGNQADWIYADDKDNNTANLTGAVNNTSNEFQNYLHGANWKFSGNNNTEYTFVFNPTANTLVITSASGGGDDTGNGDGDDDDDKVLSTDYIYVDASLVGWTSVSLYLWGTGYNGSTKLEMESVGNGIFRYKVSNGTPQGCRFERNGGTWGATKNIESGLQTGVMYVIQPANSGANNDVTINPDYKPGGGTTDPEPDPEPDPNARYVYFNPGADYYTWYNDNGQKDVDMKAFFYTGSGFNWTEHPMERVGWTKLQDNNGQVSGVTPLFRVKIAEGAWGVRFQTSDNKHWYDGKEAADANINESTTWSKYIYGPGGQNQAYQSYLSYEDYLVLKENMDEDGLYILGQNLKIADKDEAAESDYKPIDWVKESNVNTFVPEKINKDSDGIYVISMKITNPDQPDMSNVHDKRKNLPEFKISFINPKEVYDNGGFTAGGLKFQRWWATFNLGLFGPAYYIYPEGSSRQGQEFVHRNGDDTNEEHDAKVTVNTTMQFNHFNQYNWLINNPAQYTSRTLYLVIDTGDDFGTASLLNYNPRPTLSGTAGTMYRDALKEPVTVPADNHPGGYQATTTSDVVYALSNRVDVNFTCTPGPTSGDGVSSDKYTFVYELMNKVGDDYNKINEYSGEQGLTPFTKHIASMPIDNDKLYIRSTYTDNKYLSEEKQPLKFRSRVAPSTITTDINLTPLEYDGRTIIHFVPSYTHDGMMDIVLGIKYKFDPEHPFSYEGSGLQEATSENGGAAVYPGFEITLCDRNQKPIASKIGYVIPSTYPYTNNTNVRNALLNGFVWDGDNTNDVEYKYGWATKSAMAYNKNTAEENNDFEGFLPIIVPDAFTKEKMPSSENQYSLKIVLYAVYPFTFDQSAFGSASSVNGRRRIQISDDKEITTMEIDSEPAYIDLDGYNGTVSGIEDAVIEVEGEGVLYNLQGVRVTDAAPAPGIYLRRNADGSASKVVIR